MEDYYNNTHITMHDQTDDSRSADTSTESLARSEDSSKPKKRSGRKVFSETRHPVYRGVRRRNKGKWVCELRDPNKKTRIWLGMYKTAEIAARAHDLAVLALQGKGGGGGAGLNCTDSAWRLPTLPASTDPTELRRVAAALADEFVGFEREPCDGNAVGSGSRMVEIASEVEMEARFDVRECADWPLLSPPACMDGVHVNWDCYGSDFESDAGLF